MLQIVVFVLALVAVYALKAASVIRQHEQLVQNGMSFCWARPLAYDEIVASAEQAERELADIAGASSPAPASPRRAVSAA